MLRAGKKSKPQRGHIHFTLMMPKRAILACMCDLENFGSTARTLRASFVHKINPQIMSKNGSEQCHSSRRKLVLRVERGLSE